MKSILLLTLAVLFRILQVYFNYATTELVTAIINHFLLLLIGRIINLNIKPFRPI